MPEGKIIIFSAPSGAGKTSIVQALLNRNPDKLSFSISATTRAPRNGETGNKDYYYFSKEDFEKKIAENAFIEYEEVYGGSYYGTLKSEIERIWLMGKHVILDVDVKGGLNLKKYFGDTALSVFVKPPDVDTLEKRLRNRNTETEEQLKQRVEKAAFELSYEPKFDTVLENSILEEAVENAQELLDNFLQQGAEKVG